MNYNTPILIIVFNRPKETRQLISRLSELKPKRLYVACDGPRGAREGEQARVEEVRSLFENLSWDCEVVSLYRADNKGCKYGVAGAIDWFFSMVPEGIILEDDVIPSISFFRFCDEMLDRYRDEKRIFHIAGSNFLKESLFKNNDSYSFGGIYGSVWGWATWADRWAGFDVEISEYSGKRDDPEFQNSYGEKELMRHKIEELDFVVNGLDTWDFQLNFARFLKLGLTIFPRKNLIRNIGFNADATHTKTKNDSRSMLVENQLDFPLVHPNIIERNARLEKVFYDQYVSKALVRRVYRKLSSIFLRIIN